jgi:UDP-N-acetylglucosamine diphosphorylase/glucosamine-1-phosphate N-acetyltransferase
MKIYLEESECKHDLQPLTAFRHTSDLRVGMLSIKEKWEMLLPEVQIYTQQMPDDEGVITIPANLIPSRETVQFILNHFSAETIDGLNNSTFKFLHFPWQLYQFSDAESRLDFPLLTQNRKKSSVTNQATFIGNDIFIEDGAQTSHCILNSETGPIYISSGAVIMEGALIRGPFFMDQNAVVKMGAKIYGACSIGKHAVVGGELKNVVIFDHSNKVHDGYLGDSVIGSWCNIGAGTSNSNVKNTFGDVYYQTRNGKSVISAGKKAGLIMGDYSKCAINTSFYTGTLVGICCNIFGNEIPASYVPDFTWGKSKYKLDKLIQHIEQWRMNTGKPKLDNQETEKIKQAYNQTT